MNKEINYAWLLIICSMISIGQTAPTKKVQVLWEKIFGGPKVEIGWSCLQIGDNGFIIGGFTDSCEINSKEAYIIKTDGEGNEQWSKVVGGGKDDGVTSVAITHDQGFVACGGTRSYGLGNWDVYLIRLDAHGDVKWEKTYGGTELDWGSTVVQAKDGGFLIGGYTESFGAGRKDIFLIRTDSSGNEIWRKTFGGPGEEYIHGTSGMIQSGDGGFVVCGATTSFGSGMSDYYVFRINDKGDLEWEEFFGGTEDEDPLSIIEVENDNIIIAGYTTSYGAGDRDIYLVKMNSEGDECWSSTLGGPDFDCTICIKSLGNNEYILCGETKNDSHGEKDVCLIKIRE